MTTNLNCSLHHLHGQSILYSCWPLVCRTVCICIGLFAVLISSAFPVRHGSSVYVRLVQFLKRYKRRTSIKYRKESSNFSSWEIRDFDKVSQQALLTVLLTMESFLLQTYDQTNPQIQYKLLKMGIIIYCDMTPESWKSSLLDNGSLKHSSATTDKLVGKSDLWWVPSRYERFVATET